MPKKKSVENGTAGELLEALNPTEDKGKGTPGKKRATPSKRKATGMATQKKGKEKRGDEAAEDQAAAEEAAEEGRK